MGKFRQFIYKNIQGNKVLVLFLLTNLVYFTMLIVTIPKVLSFSKGLKILDMMPFGYDFEYVKTLLETLGQNGREFYLYRQIPIDLIYPFLFGITYCLLTGYFLKKLNKLNTSFVFLCFLPLLAGLFDYFENFGIIILLKSYPEISINIAKTTNIFSVLKSSFTSIFFISLLVLLISLGLKKIRNHQANKL